MTQDDVIAFLSSPAAHGGETPQILQTHISMVFLAGDRAWKLKKAVTLSFLDFSTLALREAACRSEIQVNANAARDLYLGVVPVTRRPDGSLALGGDGPAVEWLVSMRRFDQDCLLGTELAAGKVDRLLLQSVVEAVFRSHAKAAIRHDKDAIAGLRWTIDTNRAAMAGHAHCLPGETVDALAQTSHAALDRLAPLLRERAQNGKIRWCHGDLHCNNICLYQGRALAFDAIEFSADIATIDVLYDFAFLVMDLDQRGARALASHALNHYLDLSGEYQGIAALPLFLSLRAGVRAHVEAAMGRPEAARAYLGAALAYLSPPPPRLLAVGGFSGSGKSRMGRELAPLLGVPGAVVVRSDALRKQMLGAGLLDRLPPSAYDRETGRRTYDALIRTCADILRSGQSVVADAVFATPEQRHAIEAVARDAHVPFTGLWLWTDPEISAHRIAQRRNNVSDATVEVLQAQLRHDPGPMDWTRIDTGGSKDEALACGRVALCL